MLSFLLQIVAAVNANGQHDNGVFIAFNYVVPLGVLFAGLVFSNGAPTSLVSSSRKSQRSLCSVTHSPPLEVPLCQNTSV